MRVCVCVRANSVLILYILKHEMVNLLPFIWQRLTQVETMVKRCWHTRRNDALETDGWVSSLLHRSDKAVIQCCGYINNCDTVNVMWCSWKMDRSSVNLWHSLFPVCSNADEGNGVLGPWTHVHECLPLSIYPPVLWCLPHRILGGFLTNYKFKASFIAAINQLLLCRILISV